MPEFKIGLRVPEVETASRFYQGLGFEQQATVSGPSGAPVIAILRWGSIDLLVDSLDELPFALTERELNIRNGPRGLGLVIGMEVTDLTATYDYCAGEGCSFTSEIQDQPWGERTFTCIDPFGYEWKFAVHTHTGGDVDAVAAAWFGDRTA